MPHIATLNFTHNNHLSSDSRAPYCHSQLYWHQSSVFRLTCLILPLPTLLTHIICHQIHESPIATPNSTDTKHLSPDSCVPNCHFQHYWHQSSVTRFMCPLLPRPTILRPNICHQTHVSLTATPTLLTAIICLHSHVSHIATSSYTDSNHIFPEASSLLLVTQFIWFQFQILCEICLASTTKIHDIYHCA